MVIKISGHRTRTSADVAYYGIPLEEAWRSPGRSEKSSSGMFLSRWQYGGDEPAEVSSAGHESMYCVALNLKCTSVHFAYDGIGLIGGRIVGGVAHVAAPATETSARFTTPCDVLHLYVSQRVLLECHDDLFAESSSSELMLGDGRLVRDPVIERLSQALAVSQTNDTGLGRVFLDSVSLAIVSRLMSRRRTGTLCRERGPAKLPKRRMDRVTEYIDAHLAEPIGLEDMARSVGLSCMHFAAQFRKACGLRPHEYLQRRRIEYAQSLLRRPKGSILDIALNCGFRSQAHFTSVFKRFVGDTPHAWRTINNVP
ncbi:AraC family transcriptional regulator [Paraburkholderia sp. 22B1P]|uniref:AraC family transcriptional regulator n=1 Tax=Paraburkholderia sp. 22B1P TaxID=3080498 RepID=UPI0030CED6DB